MSITAQGWKWKKLTADSGGSGRQLLNLFEDSPLEDDELLAREVIQNSKDAAGSLKEKIASKAIKLKSQKPPEFFMEFELKTLKGQKLAKVWDFFGFLELKSFLEDSLKNKQQNSKIPQPDYINKSSMEFLVISDFACTGLGGSLEDPVNSNYFRALISIGITGGKLKNSGGTRGYGKAAFVAGSGVFTVLAYSKFPAEGGYKPTRHFGGVVYTFDHMGEIDYTGIGTFGDLKKEFGQVISPLIDDQADAAAALFGLPDRSKDEWNSYGTSLIILSPTVDTKQVLASVERFWWPAILDGELEVNFLFPGDDTIIVPRPKMRSDLSPYFAPYELAKKIREAQPPYEYAPEWPLEDRTDLNKEAGHKAPSIYSLGTVGYKIDPKTGFVDSDDMTEDTKSTSSYVALIRSTGMIINYEELEFRKDPIVHGVLLASKEAEGILQAQEPPSHSRWFPVKRTNQTHVYQMLYWIEDRLKHDIRTLKRKVKPPEDMKRKRIAILEKAFGELFKSRRPGPPPPPPQNKQVINFQWVKKAQLELGADGGDSRRFRSRVKIKITSPVNQEVVTGKPESSPKVISLAAQVLEDEAIVSSLLLSRWTQVPIGFSEQPNGTVIGDFPFDKWLEFETVTQDVGLVRVIVSANVSDFKEKSGEGREEE